MRNKDLHIRLTEKQADDLRAAAELNGCTITEIVIKALIWYEILEGEECNE